MIGLNEPSEGETPISHVAGLTPQIFREGGWLQEKLGLDHRPEQEQMAAAVAGALTADEPLLFEAGTGVGKSLAYLLPGIIRAMDTGRPCIVSTHTIALQEQVEQKDVPICRRLLAASPQTAGYADFKATVLVGKSNYLCTTRLASALAEKATLFSDAEFAELQRITDWAEKSETGIRHELQPVPLPEVWEMVCADSSGCSRRHCDPNRCFYQRARARLRTSQLIIVNHALLFALIAAGGARAEGAGPDARGVLFPDDFLILDEAHTVPEVATQHFGLSLSSYGVDRALKSLHNPRTKRGVLRKRGGLEGAALVERGLEASARFFAAVELSLLAPRPVARLREPSEVETLLDAPLAALQKLLVRLSDKLDDGRERDELLEHAARMKSIQLAVSEWLTLGDQGAVYWAERGGKRQTIVTLRGAPIDVAPELRRHLFGRGVSVICTSATLALGGEIAPFARRVGADDARTGIVLSPFDFERNMRVYIASDIPLPSAAEARLSLDIIADYIQFCALKCPGGTLVLFTSYADLRTVAAQVQSALGAAGRPLLIQGDAANRTELARQMRALGNAVLFGTDSFWTGVDIPGAALSQVIITRLPFDPPDHPVAEAQAERIRDAGGNPFNELTLPDALIKFRQGVGRLIRSQSDRGVITLLDARLLAKSYGRLFLDCLPQKEFSRLTRTTREERFMPFL
jgi:ATP-dependent DNA helicase DinG